MAGLRAALEQWSAAQRFVIRELPLAFPVRGESSYNVPFAFGGVTGRASDVTVLAVPVTDTVKEVVNGIVSRTVPRETLAEAVGPWLFSRDTLAKALDRIGDNQGLESVVAICRAAGLPVRVQLVE
jgi:hypothetical protein